VRLPASTALFFVCEVLIGGRKSSEVGPIRKVRAMRRHHVDPKEESVGELGKHFSGVIETRGRAIANIEVEGQSGQCVPSKNPVTILVEAVSNSGVLM
jgi:hypothetical protein